MPRILYGVSPIGLGHATRSLVIIDELKKRGAQVRVFSGGKAAEFIRGQGVLVDDIVDDAVPSVDGLEMKRVSQWYVRSWLAQRRNLRRAQGLISSFKPDVVVGDEEFSGVTAAEGAGVRRALIADELTLGFARGWLAKKIEARVGRWYSRLQDSVDLLIVPEEGVDSGNRRFVGPIVRKVTSSCGEVRSRHGVPQGRVVLFSMSGSGLGGELGTLLLSALDAPGLEDVTLVVTGNRGRRLTGKRVVDLGVVPDNQDLVACSDLVVSTAGKSTMDEAAAAGTPVIAIPLRHHAEQERNAAALGYRFEDASRLRTLVAEKIGRRGAPREFRGEEEASRLILSLVQGPLTG